MNKKLCLVFSIIFASIFICFINTKADVDSDLFYLQSQLERNQAEIQKNQKDYRERIKALKKSLEYKKQNLKKEYLENLNRLKEERARLIEQEKEAQGFLEIRERKRRQPK